MVEHSTADREVPGSNPSAPFKYYFFEINFEYLKKNFNLVRFFKRIKFNYALFKKNTSSEDRTRDLLRVKQT